MNRWIWFEDWTVIEISRLLNVIDSLESHPLEVLLECVNNKDQYSHESLDHMLKQWESGDSLDSP